MPTRRHLPAFTLAEALVACAVLALAVAAILTPFSAAAKQQDRAAKLTQAALLAEQGLEECLAQTVWTSSTANPPALGPAPGETARNQYLERTDFSGFTESPAQFGLRYGPAQPAADFLPNLTRRFNLQYVYLPGMDSAAQPELMMLTVRVFDGEQELVTLRRFISKHEDH
jgi:type II secretory pathway pseudopilin PulG